MAVDLDETDWSILRALQADGRASFAELARQVHLSPSATSERVRRLESLGVISGYRAVVDLDRVGVGLMAVVRLKYFGHQHQPFLTYVEGHSQFLEALRITGEDCYVIKVVARSMPQLQQFVDDLGRYGDPTTSLVYSHALPLRGVRGPLPD